MKIPYKCKSFPSTGAGGGKNGTFTLATGWEDLTWAAITVGRRNLHHVLSHGAYSWFEVIYRAHMLWANLKTDKRGWLRRAEPYEALDPSEKGAVSFFLGMAAAKLFAENLLQVPWLVHMSAFTGGAALSPDLIGRRRPSVTTKTEEWVVIEAKGRTHGLKAKIKMDALAQAKKLGHFTRHGKQITPVLRIASIAYFAGGRFNVYWEDPEEEEPDQADSSSVPDIVDARMLDAYYGPLVNLVRTQRFDVQERQVANRIYDVVSIPELDLFIGVTKGIVERLPPSDAVAQSASFAQLLDFIPSTRTQQERVVAYPDGVMVELGDSWTDAKMERQPGER